MNAAPRPAFGRPFARPAAPPLARPDTALATGPASPAPTAKAAPPRRAFGQVARPAAMQAPAAPATAEVEPLLDGFTRVDGRDRPARVSEEAWSLVFPPDYPRARRLAGRFFAYGHAPDDAVRQAIDEIEREHWKDASRPDHARLERLKALFPDGGVDRARRLPIPPLSAAVRAVAPTARAHWREIAQAKNPEQLAFVRRAWHAPSGHCLVCGRPAGEGDLSYQGDALHAACKPLMRDIGPAFCALVLEEVERIAAEPPALPDWTPDPGVDPDDPATWGDY